ncbi:hypothetical protein ACVU7I_08585 [Patulibacter sp. S7RM1-6]
MSVVAPLVILVLFGACLVLLSQPLWPGHGERRAAEEDLRRVDLEAARLAKYREIRDAELDRDTGKLSAEDWRAVDRRLRAEAVAILDELDALGGPDAGGSEGAAPDAAAAR